MSLNELITVWLHNAPRGVVGLSPGSGTVTPTIYFKRLEDYFKNDLNVACVRFGIQLIIFTFFTLSGSKRYSNTALVFFLGFCPLIKAQKIFYGEGRRYQ